MLQTLRERLQQPHKIVIIPHKNPDGDAIGSVTALCGYLEQLNHEVTMISPNEFPDFLNWLPLSEEFVIYDQETDKATEKLKEAEMTFHLDHNAFHRTGQMEEVLQNLNTFFVMVDHHQQPDNFADLTFSDPSMSSTCEMIYHLITGVGDAKLITPAMATSMYTGILTDTGSFKYRSTTPTTMRVAADLMDMGANSESINRKIYDVNTPSRMKLLGVALSNLRILPEYRTAFITLSQQELDENNFNKGDTEGFVNYALSLNDVVFAQIFIEKESEGIIKTSLRSKGDFDVNLMARKHWDGGGHRNAAGGKSELDMDATMEKLISILPAYEKELLQTAI